MHFSKILFLTMVLGLYGCGSKSTNENDGPLMDKSLQLFTYGDAYKPLEKKLRIIHGRELAQAIDEKLIFAATQYEGDGRDISGFTTTLRVTFLYAQKSQNEWPLELKAHYILENDGKTIFNEVYQVTATQFNASSVCQGCNSETAALKMLKNKVLPELILALKK
ncbi:hypothetical protein [Pleionea sediminis]|uniref:hypothetical protein n=1 Tax=Pleionea sediminis TaxID=2569479 RepID=UPI001186AA2E|nr:hypothetical protein [Pleionea sediminis]